MRLLTTFLFIFTLNSCREPREFHPFTAEYNLSLEALRAQARDTINAGCGFLNITLDTGRLIPYYQLSPGGTRVPLPQPVQALLGRKYLELGPQWQIAGKGFYLPLDSIHRQGSRATEETYNFLLDQLQTSPPDTSGLNQLFAPYGYRIGQLSARKLKLHATRPGVKPVELYLSYALSSNEQYLVRSVSYLK